MSTNQGRRSDRRHGASLVRVIIGILLLTSGEAHAQVLPSVSPGEPGEEFPPPRQDWMGISLAWTSYRGHRNGPFSALDLELEGNISSSLPTAWVLSIREPAPNLLADLHLVEAVDGEAVFPGTDGVPLSWRISVDAGPFAPLEQIDGAMRLALPPGQHSILLRISGIPRLAQRPGYYRLVLDQCVVPLL